MLRCLLLLSLMLLLVIAVLPFSVAQADCDFSFSNYARAVQLHDMGDYERALQHYHCAQLEDPADAIIPILIENVYEDIANASSAWSRRESTASATACDPALDHARLGAEAHEAGNTDRALIHLECALRDNPQNKDPLYRMGQIYINRGDTRTAQYYFNRAELAAATNADQVEREDLLTVLLGAEARSVLNADDLKNLSLTSPDPAESGEYLPPGYEYQRSVLIVIWTRRRDGNVDAQQADNRYTIGRLEQALKQDPTRVDLRCELGRLYMARGDYAAAFGQFYPLISERLGDHCNR